MKLVKLGRPVVAVAFLPAGPVIAGCKVLVSLSDGRLVCLGG